jgi:hypothetical protein
MPATPSCNSTWAADSSPLVVVGSFSAQMRRQPNQIIARRSSNNNKNVCSGPAYPPRYVLCLQDRRHAWPNPAAR